jgi:hypothetical protein
LTASKKAKKKIAHGGGGGSSYGVAAPRGTVSAPHKAEYECDFEEDGDVSDREDEDGAGYEGERRDHVLTLGEHL